MPDNEIKVVIRTEAQLEAVKKAIAEYEKLVSLGSEPTAADDALNDVRQAAVAAYEAEKNLTEQIKARQAAWDDSLATKPGFLDEPKKTSGDKVPVFEDYAPQTEAEYDALVRTAEALRVKIALMKAVGEEVAKIAESQARLEGVEASLATASAKNFEQRKQQTEADKQLLKEWESAEKAHAEEKKRIEREKRDAERETARVAREAKRAQAEAARAAKKAEEEARTGTFWGALRSQIGKLTTEVPMLGQAFTLFSNLTKGPLGIVTAAVAALAAAWKTAKRALEEYMSSEVNVAKLDTALAQAGQLTDDYRVRLQKLADRMQEVTGVGSDEWIKAMTKLTQFGADESNIERYMEAVKNLAGLTGSDIPTAATMFSRALQGNFQMFARYGIHVQDASTQTEKMNKLMEDLAKRGGGQLEAQTQTLSGQFKALGNASLDLLKGLGKIIAETKTVQFVLYGLTETLKFLGKAFDTTIGKIPGLKNALVKTKQSFDEVKVSVDNVKTAYQNLQDGQEAYYRRIKEDEQFEIASIRLAKEKAMALLEQERASRALTENPMSEAEFAGRKAGIESKSEEETYKAKQKALQLEIERRQSNITRSEHSDKIADDSVEKTEKEAEAWRKYQEKVAQIRNLQEEARKITDSLMGSSDGNPIYDFKKEEELRILHKKIDRIAAEARAIKVKEVSDADVEKSKAEAKAVKELNAAQRKKDQSAVEDLRRQKERDEKLHKQEAEVRDLNNQNAVNAADQKDVKSNEDSKKKVLDDRHKFESEVADARRDKKPLPEPEYDYDAKLKEIEEREKKRQETLRKAQKPVAPVNPAQFGSVDKRPPAPKPMDAETKARLDAARAEAAAEAEARRAEAKRRDEEQFGKPDISKKDDAAERMRKNRAEAAAEAEDVLRKRREEDEAKFGPSILKQPDNAKKLTELQNEMNSKSDSEIELLEGLVQTQREQAATIASLLESVKEVKIVASNLRTDASHIS